MRPNNITHSFIRSHDRHTCEHYINIKRHFTFMNYYHRNILLINYLYRQKCNRSFYL
jgi:hypothetical protein